MIKSFGDIGEDALGKPGRFLTNFSVYVTVVGIVIIYLILIGQMLSAIFPCLSHGLFTIAIGVVMMPVAIFVKSMKEAAWMSIFALCTTYVAGIIAITLTTMFYLSDDYLPQQQKFGFHTEPANFETMAIGFSVFVFALGAHPIFPSIYSELREKNMWGMTTNLGWVLISVLYFLVAIICYLAYGDVLSGNDTILTTIAKYYRNDIAIKLANFLFVGHFVCAIPIFLNEFLGAVDSFIESSETCKFPSTLMRILCFTAMIIVGLFFPYFTDIMGIITDVSVSLGVFVLPVVFYWRLGSPGMLEKIWMVIVLAFGIIGSVVGIVVTVIDLGNNIRENPINVFFDQIFIVNMSLCSIN